ncbi:hypothetical protein MKW98_001024 [Papaver atlanticum]|uniref:Cytochrome P450 n=1 Tax=Papaver atlanticum TaxID=357466 RepID=A0AAD4XCK0_9MAGN|nr:hypothetical protein MKW98_001024 [Papaver atlanticum]
MVDLGILLSCFPYIFLIFFTFLCFFYNTKSSSSLTSILPKSYPIIGSSFALLANRDRHNQWVAEILAVCPTNTYVIRYPGTCMVFTAYPPNVKYIANSHFSNYPKGRVLKDIFNDFFGNGIINTDDTWKFQRQMLSHEFNSASLRKFVEEAVKIEIFHRLIPVLSMTAENNSELDLQDIFQRFSFDTICKLSFGYDPSYLSPSLQKTEFAVAFEDATRITGERIAQVIPLVWKLKRFLNIGSEKILKQATATIQESARKIIRQKKHELKGNFSLATSTDDLLSRMVKAENLDEDFMIDVAIAFILAGQDTTSAALTWFFWLVSSNPEVEKEILKEINQIGDEPGYDDVKDMVYIHAALCESMRLYPPVPVESKEAENDDILPDGTIIKKGMIVLYSSYAMGRMENLWGLDWNEFKPDRWLQRENVTGKLSFVGKDSYTYPVFNAGPRVCLGKEMAFLQMKVIVVEFLRRFHVVPAANGNNIAPVFVSYVTAKMKGGFPVKIEKRRT